MVVWLDFARNCYNIFPKNLRYVLLNCCKIAFYRKRCKLTQIELAEKAGISRTHLSNIAAANVAVNPSLQTLLDIADALEIEPAKLLEFKA